MPNTVILVTQKKKYKRLWEFKFLKYTKLTSCNNNSY